MVKLIYSATVSLDGCVNDSDGSIDWTSPDDEVLAFLNERLRPIGTFLFGRRMYEVMSYWENADAVDLQAAARDFVPIWRDSDKIVYSSSLESTSTARTRLERSFDPAETRRIIATADRDLCVGGPGLAASAIRAGLVDEYHLYVAPVILGGGTRYFPDDVRVELELVDEHRFGSGVVFARYRHRR